MSAQAGLLLKIGGDDSQFAAAIKRSQARLQAFGKQIQSMGTKITGFGKQLTVYAGILSAPLAGSIAMFSTAGSELNDFSQRLGISVESLSEMKYASEMAGSSLSELTSGLATMTANLSKQSTKTAAMLGKIGLSFSELDGLSPEKAFEKISEAINNTEDQTTKLGVAMAVFGGAGKNILPVIKDMKDLREEANKLGVVFSTTDAEYADELGDAFDRVKTTLLSVSHTIASALAPTITDIANRAAIIISAIREWIANNKNLVLTVSGIIVGIVALGAGLVGVGSAITLLGMSVAGLGTALGVVTTVLSAILSPMGLFIAGVAAGSYAFFTMTKSGQDLVNFFINEFSKLFNIVKPIIDSIVKAFKMGDLVLAASIAFTAVKIPALQLWAFIKNVFNEGSNYVLTIWDAMVFGLLKAWVGLKTGLTFDFLKLSALHVAQFVSDKILLMIEGIVNGFKWAIDKILNMAYGVYIGGVTLISDQEFLSAKKKVADIGKGISDLRTSSNSFFDSKIEDNNRDIDNSEGMREIKQLDSVRKDNNRQRILSAQQSSDAAQQAIVDAQNELRELMSRSASAVDETNDSVRNATTINPAKETSKVVGVQATGNFSAAIANMLAANAQNSIEQQQLDVLKEIAFNTSDMMPTFSE